MRSLSLQVTILYIFFAILNISFFTIIIFENQIDLITENTKYKTREVANNVYSQLTAATERINGNPETYGTADSILAEIGKGITGIVGPYAIFKEDRTILFKSDNDFALDEANLLDALRAFKNKEFIGQFYYSRIDEKTREIYFYVPLNLLKLDNTVLFFKLRMKELNERMTTLYGIVGLIICIITVFHIIFGFMLNRILIAPIRKLAEKAKEISAGNLSARVRLEKKNEIGMLGNSFDAMADSIQDKITRLDDQNKKMKMDLVMARHVQKSIYPGSREYEKFSIAVYHRPLMEVSGDFHDVFPLGNGRYGFLIADVSGHGVSAALITMLIKQIFQKMANKYADTKFLFRYMNDELGNLMTTFDKYFTSFYLIIDRDNKLTFTNAGHQKTYLIREEGSKIYELDTDGAFIGLSKDMSARFASKCVQLYSKDKLFLFTDGIIEAIGKNGNDYELKRLLEIIRKNSDKSCGRLLETILEDFSSFTDESRRRDDETIMIIEIK